MLRSIKIMLWNANGIVKQLESVDVCLISESHLTSQSCFNVENYETYHTTHPLNCGRGGSVILIRKQIKHNPGTNVSCS